jgi:hypothetical protein
VHGLFADGALTTPPLDTLRVVNDTSTVCGADKNHAIRGLRGVVQNGSDDRLWRAPNRANKQIRHFYLPLLGFRA